MSRTMHSGHGKGVVDFQCNEEELNNEQAIRYRAIVARANYLSPDRPDIAYAVKEFARSMSAPTKGDWERLCR